MVATSSVFATAAPQAEQKRIVAETSEPHEMHLDMIFPATV